MAGWLDQFINSAKQDASKIQGGVGKLVSSFQQNPQVQQVENSPLGLAVQGKFNKVIPAIQQEFSPSGSTIAGKPYKPQLAIGGEMETVNPAMEGAPLPPTQENPAPVAPEVAPAPKNAPVFPQHDYTGVNSWSPFIRDTQSGEIVSNPNFKAGSTTPTQMSQTPPTYPQTPANPESISNLPPQTNPGVTRPQIPEQPALTPEQMKNFAKSGLDKYQLPSSYGDKRVPLEQVDKSVMANVVKGNSPEEVMAKLPAAEQTVWKQVTDKAATISNVSVDKNVMPYIDNKLQDLVHKGLITDTQAQQFSQMERLNILGKTADAGLNPNETIEGSKLIDLQTGANAKAPKTIPQNTTSPIPYVNQAISQGYRDAIGNVDPNIRYLYNQYSSLKRIGDMSTSFRNTEGNPPGFLDELKRNPLTTIVGASVGLPALAKGVQEAAPYVAGAGIMADKYLVRPALDLVKNKINEYEGGQGLSGGSSQKSNPNQQSQNDLSNPHANSITQGVNSDGSFGVSQIPQAVGQVKLNPDGSVIVANPTQIKDASGKVIATDPNDANKQIKVLQDDIANQHKIAAADPYTPGTQTATAQTIAADNAQLSSLKTLSDSSAPLNEAYKHVNTITGKTATVLKTLSSSSPDIGNLNHQIDDILNSLDPAYAGLKQQLSGISKAISGGNLDVKTQGSLINVLKTINQQNAYDYYQAIQSFVGAPTTQSMAPNAQGVPAFPAQSTPESAPSAPQDFSSIVGGKPPSLPATPPAFPQ